MIQDHLDEGGGGVVTFNMNLKLWLKALYANTYLCVFVIIDQGYNVKVTEGVNVFEKKL